jgi:hypothetical protein
MNVNNLIISTLSPLVADVVPTKYTGASTTYITFNYEDDRAEEYADDTPQMDVAYLQIHLFCHRTFNFNNLKKQIRSSLFKAGFSYARITAMYEDDTETNHIIFQVEIERESEIE